MHLPGTDRGRGGCLVLLVTLNGLSTPTHLRLATGTGSTSDSTKSSSSMITLYKYTLPYLK